MAKQYIDFAVRHKYRVAKQHIDSYAPSKEIVGAITDRPYEGGRILRLRTACFAQDDRGGNEGAIVGAICDRPLSQNGNGRRLSIDIKP